MNKRLLRKILPLLLSIILVVSIIIPVYSSGIDAYVVSLLHCDGTNGSTTITDVIGNTFSVAGSAQITTANYKFATGSLKIINDADYVRCDSANTNFGTGDFTVDMWVYTPLTNSQACLWDNLNAGGGGGRVNSILIRVSSAGKLNIFTQNGALTSSSSAISSNTWTHIAVVRTSGTINYFINGTKDSATPSCNTNCTTSAEIIGSPADVLGSANNGFRGYVDEVRVSKGIARWTSSFTPPTSPYDGLGIVTAQAATSIRDTTATGNGNITDIGIASITERGIVYSSSTHSQPANVSPASSGYGSVVYETGTFSTGAFTESLTGLSINTTYYYRSYAYNTAGYTYSSTEISFTTYNSSASSNSTGFVMMGRMVAGENYTTGLTAFTTVNNGNCAIDITLSGTDMVGGNTWTLSDTATPGSNIYGIKAGVSGGDYTIVVKKSAPYETLVSNLAIGASQQFGFKFYVPTSIDDGVAKVSTVTLNIVMH